MLYLLFLLCPSISLGKAWTCAENETFGGVGVEYRRWNLEGRRAISRRWDFRACYGLRDWLEVKARVGMASLDIHPSEGWTEYKAAYRPLLGAGAHIRILKLGQFVAYIEGGGSIFRPSGVMLNTTGPDTLRSKVSYRPWGEYSLCFGVGMPPLGAYGAIAFQGVVTEGERCLTEEGQVLERRWESYRSGVRWALILGGQLELGRGFRLSAEVWASSDVIVMRSYEDLAVRLELVQRYVPEKEPF